MCCGFESEKSQKIVITIHHFFHQLSDETSGLGVCAATQKPTIMGSNPAPVVAAMTR